TSGSVLAGDSFIGALSRASGNNVGTYAITLGTLSLGTNYELTLAAGSTFEIKKRPLQVTADAGQFKNYGDSDRTLTYTVTSGSLAYTDSFTGVLSRVAGQNAGLYAITIGSLAISDGNSGNNYMLSFVSNNFEVKKRLATWTTNNNSKLYGALDPVPL